MPLFVLTCLDKPGALDLRLATREAHLAYADGCGNTVKLGGPFLNDSGAMIGSLIVVEAEDRAAAEAFSANDPYRKAGVFASVDIRAFRAVRGSLA